MIKAITKTSTFTRETSVEASIHADQPIVWALLTNIADYPRWNSTIISISGKLVAGEKIKLKSTLAPQRTFTLKVKKIVEGKMFTWGDGMGQRVYTLEKRGIDTQFRMVEKIGGPLFPLFSRMIITNIFTVGKIYHVIYLQQQ